MAVLRRRAGGGRRKRRRLAARPCNACGCISGGANAGLLASVTLRRQTNGGAWSTVRQVQYTYYDGTQPYGNPGDLMLREKKGPGVVNRC